jgi:hypothetical protein
MKKITLTLLSIILVSSMLIYSCKKEEAPLAEPMNPSFIEEFDTLANVLEKGWAITNNSQPIGSSSWNQGALTRLDIGKVAIDYPFFASSSTYSGKDFLLASYNSGDVQSTISCWLISKPVLMKNGDIIEFFTRSAPIANWNTTNKADRLQVFLNPLNNTADVGNTALSTGSFTMRMLDINPTYQTSGVNMYPKNWTKYSVTVSGLAAPVSRRFAFRYFVENGGEDGARSYAVGIDRVEFISK